VATKAFMHIAPRGPPPMSTNVNALEDILACRHKALER
jgi:hypothetical protein